jgi:hypothetical protein
MMTEHEILVSRYIDAWNETDSSRREALAGQVLLETGRYTDPMMSSAGPKEFAGMIGAFQAQMPGLTFERVGGIDATGAMVALQLAFDRCKRPPVCKRYGCRRIFHRWTLCQHHWFSRQHTDGGGLERGEIRGVLGRA